MGSEQVLTVAYDMRSTRMSLCTVGPAPRQDETIVVLTNSGNEVAVMARRSRQTIVKRQRELRQAEKAALKRQKREGRRQTDAAGEQSEDQSPDASEPVLEIAPGAAPANDVDTPTK